MYEVSRKTITLDVHQHEQIVGMKRGNDTLCDVVDRLLERDSVYSIIDGRLESLETTSNRLWFELRFLESVIKELKELQEEPACDGDVEIA